jgi:major membrane immunogen (membrane-anchored lipoprotein)
MTRGIVSFVLVAALMVVAFTGCAKKAVYVDGSYVSHSTADDRGNVGQITLTIAGDKITDAKLADLQVKTKDNYQYQTSLDAWATLEQSLVTSQDVTKVDAVAKATGTSTLFKEAATVALEMAKNK